MLHKVRNNKIRLQIVRTDGRISFWQVSFYNVAHRLCHCARGPHWRSTVRRLWLLLRPNNLTVDAQITNTESATARVTAGGYAKNRYVSRM